MRFTIITVFSDASAHLAYVENHSKEKIKSVKRVFRDPFARSTPRLFRRRRCATEQTGPVAKSARNWRGTSDLTPSIRPIGAAYAISTSRSHGARVHCHAKPRHESQIPIRLPFAPAFKHEGSVARGPDSRNRIESNRCFHPAQCAAVPMSPM